MKHTVLIREWGGPEMKKNEACRVATCISQETLKAVHDNIIIIVPVIIIIVAMYRYIIILLLLFCFKTLHACLYNFVASKMFADMAIITMTDCIKFFFSFFKETRTLSRKKVQNHHIVELDA